MTIDDWMYVESKLAGRVPKHPPPTYRESKYQSYPVSANDRLFIGRLKWLNRVANFLRFSWIGAVFRWGGDFLGAILGSLLWVVTGPSKIRHWVMETRLFADTAVFAPNDFATRYYW